MNKSKFKIAIIGLGYVGLPLYNEFYKKKFNVIGYDIDKTKLRSLYKNFDVTRQVLFSDLKKINKNNFTDKVSRLHDCNVYIVTVPTPINKKKEPDLNMLKNACTIIGKSLNNHDLVIFESTVYPGATEEFCKPILEKYSNLKVGEFGLGFSPERINPGDKINTFKNIIKIISGNNNASLKKIISIYKNVFPNICKVKSIKIAEAAKIIENTQRDINIALVNEFSMLLRKMKINTQDVINAASTKWNFAYYTPGFVGGHCIGVDPYYLSYKFKSHNIKPKMILSGRFTNENFVKNISKELNQKFNINRNTNILIAGITFKKDISDTRNTKIVDFDKFLNGRKYFYDPFADSQIIDNINLIKNINKKKFDVIIIAVPHNNFLKDRNLINLIKNKKIILIDFYDIFKFKKNLYKL